MKRFIGVVALISVVSLSLAQAFTIRRPTEGSKVREMVPIRIPKGSIPDGSYIGVIVNGKFLEAALPKVEDEDYVYYLDTKGRKLPDGDLDLEVVLYMDFNDRAEIVNRSSIKVKLDNYTSIKVPDEGLKLRYIFKKGQEFVYTTSQIQTAGMVSQAMAQIGSRAGELPVGTETVRMLYAVDNTFVGEDGEEALLRMQALPEKGKNYAMLTPTGSASAKKYFDFQMAPVYMRISSTGREQWGSVPAYFPLEGTSGELSTLDLIATFPLPVLPSKALYPGDTWQAQQLFSTLDLENLEETEKLTTALASRGTFVGVEWERGIPCAKFTVAVDAGPREIASAINLNNQPGQATKVSLSGIIWFSLDKGIIVKSDMTILQESVINAAGTGGGGGGGQAGPGQGGVPGKGASLGGGAVGGFNSIRPEDFVFKPFVDGNGQVWFFQNRGGPPGSGGGDFGFGGPGSGGGAPAQGPGFGQRTGGGSGVSSNQILRVRLRLLSELEL